MAYARTNFGSTTSIHFKRDICFVSYISFFYYFLDNQIWYNIPITKIIESWLSISKLYDINSSFSTPFVELYNNLLNSFIPFSSFMPLDFIKNVPLISLSIACKESVIISDLASFIAPKLNINFDSAKKDIERFLSNKNYDFNYFYSKFISLILSSYKIKRSDKRIHISVDHGDIEDPSLTLAPKNNRLA